MNRRRFVSSAAAAAVGTVNPKFATSLRDRLQTRAELSDYAETSSNADVERFLETLDQRGAPVVRGILGVSPKGRNVPYVVGSRPPLASGDAAHALRKPVVFIVAGARAGEPDGKEAVLAVLRDLSLATDHTILEDMVLVVVPNLDVDGNASLQAVATNAPDLDGPARVGASRSAAGVALDLDFLALRTRTVANLVALVEYWDPDVYIDLRTQSSSYTAFSLTYAPAMHPAAFYAGPYARDTMLPVLRTNLKDKFGIEAFTAGGFGPDGPLAVPSPGVDLGWYASGDDARAAVNYLGIRGTTAVAAFASPHDVFERRVFYLRAFLETALQFCSDKSDELIARRRLASHWTTGAIPLRTARDTHPSGTELISWQEPSVDRFARDRQLGMPTGFHLEGRFVTSPTPVFDRFVGTLYAQQPFAYVFDARRDAVARELAARHGLRSTVLRDPTLYHGETFVPTRIDAVTRADGSTARLVRGTWTAGTFVAPAGALFLYGEQPQGPLLSLLLEPESDAGLVALHAFDATLAAGAPHPVRRVSAPA